MNMLFTLEDSKNETNLEVDIAINGLGTTFSIEREYQPLNRLQSELVRSAKAIGKDYSDLQVIFVPRDGTIVVRGSQIPCAKFRIEGQYKRIYLKDSNNQLIIDETTKDYAFNMGWEFSIKTDSYYWGMTEHQKETILSRFQDSLLMVCNDHVLISLQAVQARNMIITDVSRQVQEAITKMETILEYIEVVESEDINDQVSEYRRD